MINDYWDETSRLRLERNLTEGSGIFVDTPQDVRDAFREKIVRGFETGKPFHAFVNRAGGSVIVLSASNIAASLNIYPDRGVAEKCTKRESGDSAWADAAWI